MALNFAVWSILRLTPSWTLSQKRAEDCAAAAVVEPVRMTTELVQGRDHQRLRRKQREAMTEKGDPELSNLATVQSIYEAFGRGDVPAILDVLAPDVEWEAWADNSAVQAGVPWMRPYRGREAVLGFFEAVGGMEITDLQVLSMMEGGNQIAVEFVIEVTLPGFGGGHYRDEEIHLWTFNDEGKVSRLRHYTDTAKHIAALGR
jgi:ketosteroid isomerase-like protein